MILMSKLTEAGTPEKGRLRLCNTSYRSVLWSTCSSYSSVIPGERGDIRPERSQQKYNTPLLGVYICKMYLRTRNVKNISF